MKKLLIIIVLVASGLYIAQHNGSTPQADKKDRYLGNNNTELHSDSARPTKTKDVGIFVPYWNVQKVPYTVAPAISDNTTTELYYFGVTTDDQGEILHDDGFNSLNTFLEHAKKQRGTKTFLTLRLTNSFDNLKLLDDKDLQQKVIENTVQLAKQHGFDGVVLDLEVSAIPSDTLKNQISDFTTGLFTSSQKANMLLYVTLYGDVFYRGRPYDIGVLASHTDKILIMAYDFHKASGTPGPNFPLHSNDLYDYSLETLLVEMNQIVPSNKIGLVFGLYGYEWTTDSNSRPLKPARALFASAIADQSAKCRQNNDCKIDTDTVSAELRMSWKDEDGYFHHYWTETADSIGKKINVANKSGISSIAFWAHGYY